MNRNGPERYKSFTNIHATSYRCGWPTGFGAVILVLTLEYLLPRLSEFQASPLLIYFRDGRNRCAHRTNYGTILIWYVMLHFRDQRGEASLLHRISSATTVLLCENRSPIRYYFRCGAKGIRYGVNWAVNSGIRSFTWKNFGTSRKGLLKIVQEMK